jgi:hypothetical protein
METDCWCDYPDPECPGESHDEYIDRNDYPFHLYSPTGEWNVPEPLPGE